MGQVRDRACEGRVMFVKFHIQQQRQAHSNVSQGVQEANKKQQSSARTETGCVCVALRSP